MSGYETVGGSRRCGRKGQATGWEVPTVDDPGSTCYFNVQLPDEQPRPGRSRRVGFRTARQTQIVGPAVRSSVS